MPEKIDNQALLSGDRRALAKCITLVESTLPADRALATSLIEDILPNTGNSLRIGISGARRGQIYLHRIVRPSSH